MEFLRGTLYSRLVILRRSIELVSHLSDYRGGERFASGRHLRAILPTYPRKIGDAEEKMAVERSVAWVLE